MANTNNYDISITMGDVLVVKLSSSGTLKVSSISIRDAGFMNICSDTIWPDI